MRSYLIFILSLSTVAFAFGAEFIPFDGASLSGGLSAFTTEKSLNQTEIEIIIDGVLVDNLDIQGEFYSHLSWENGGVEGEIGRPEIPVYRLFLEIPFGAKVKTSILKTEKLELALSDLRISGTIYPIQPPLEKLPGAKAVFQKDGGFYSNSGYSNRQIAEVEEYFILRGHQIASVIIRPLDYNPAEGKVTICKNLSFQFNFIGGDMGRTVSNLNRYSSPYFDNIVMKMVSNPGVFVTDELPNPIEYLVICGDNPNYLTAIDPLINWKHSKGFHTMVVTTALIGTTANEIRSYITTAYNTWEIPPTFVLLVGDTPLIPNFTGQGAGNPPTDLYYAAIDGGDYFADLGLGRFSPGDIADLQNMVNKTLNVEQVLWTGNDDWEKHATFMASNDNYTISEGTHNFVISHYLQPLGYTCDMLYCHTYNATTQQVTNAFNAGRSQGTYSGHGSVTSWADGPPFSQGNVQALTNTVYPIIQSYACLTGNYTSGECFGETWVREPHAASVFIGSTVTSYWNEDDILEKRVYEGWYDNQLPGDTVNFTWVNGFFDYGKIGLYNFYGNTSTVRRYFEMYNVLGDGSLDMWTDIPEQITVQNPAVMFLGTNQITVTASGYPDWALVCAHSSVQEEVWASGYVNSAGSITLTFDTPPTMPGNLIITVTGHNIDPVVHSIPLTPAAGPYIVYSSATINDASAWNPNGLWDYDETVYLNMTLYNVGVTAAAGVSAVIHSTSPDVTIMDSTATFGYINASSTATVNNAYLIDLSPNVEDGQIIPFTITVTSDTSSWTTNFNLVVYAPDIVYNQVVINDSPPGGNGNFALDPGESAVMELFLKNDGSSPVTALELNLAVEDTNIDLITTAGAYGSLFPGEITSALFSLEVEPTCPQNYNVLFEGDYTASHALSGEIEFTLTVGNLLYLPTGPDNYGYSAYDIHDTPILPVYSWIEIDPALGGLGTEIPFTSDDQTFTYNLPFTFRYYGQDYTQYSVCSNGWIAMGTTTSVDWSNSSIPNGDGPPAMIAPFWEDLSPQIIGNVCYYYEAVQHIYIVEYSGVRQYTPTTAIETFEVILYDPAHYATTTSDGEIKFQYRQVSDPSSCTIGIENSAQNIGLQYLYDNNYDIHASLIDSAMAILFTTGREPANLSIVLTPATTPIVIPVTGGAFDYSLVITNNGITPISFDGWTEVTLPSGTVFGPLILRDNLVLTPGGTIIRNLLQTVPASAPSGNYTYWGKVGVYPTLAYDQDSFPFTKSGMMKISNPGYSTWDVSGWEDDGDDFTIALPERFALHQNYPNPFNPSTTVIFALPEACRVDIRVFDVQGREVANLISGSREAGEYQVEWNAEGNSGGVYFIRMEAGDYTSVVKTLLLK